LVAGQPAGIFYFYGDLMRRKILLQLATILTFSAQVFAQSKTTPYAGQQQREIKALSASDIKMYLEGSGMGLGKAAELNHYPGPRHVLDSATELKLSHEQFTKTQQLYDKMHNAAVRLGELIVQKERQLDSLYATQKISEAQLRAVVGEIAKLQGELRVVHLNAHLEMKKILTPAQTAKYDELRGYGKSPALQRKH
jgi:Spy/CpxP family protein refolding chaperone